MRVRDTKMSLDFDPSIPNTDTAVVQVLDPESLRPVNAGTAVSNRTQAVLRRSRDESVNAELNLHPGTNYTGRLTFVSGEKLGRKARLHVSLACNGKIKVLHRTKAMQCDKKGIAYYEETFGFQAPPEASLIFGGTSYHLMRRDEHLGIAQIPLDDPSVNRGKLISTNLDKGIVNFRLNYPVAEVEEEPEAQHFLSDYRYPDDESQYEEKMYGKNVVV
ncbi:hypothetical protein ZYGR_0N04770 [Zygosaccharomyces rouxii]|uniref:ZYRO0D11242p n=2 Tax=Zygosaccharomyces rouxii TaxID=4956 RepID=C5DW20_ZYGRC|nr:uncharacterized protein ZYRO0D11242g [Zygosaccharomyces rouxii]KAH9200899.1 hypothetical protein LQ764DRAFT_101446 [Zygosaccharomyces rouxii]GAV49072.1 hypothetical protein ZYGR_0N04770 [Zygosaccharomyces rouxii]CAR27989.1 ZYRO0D11242p [Zygosaccharomyces rouxii]